MLFSKNRHIKALKGFRKSVQEYGRLRKMINETIGEYDFRDRYPPWTEAKNVVGLFEIEWFLSRAFKDWDDLREKLHNAELCNASRTDGNQYLRADLNAKDKEIQRLKEVIACVSSRVIEIVETEKAASEVLK